MNGIANIGNTCFINSIIQCLYHIKSLREYVLSEIFPVKNRFLEIIQLIFKTYNEDCTNNIKLLCELIVELSATEYVAECICDLNSHNDAGEFLNYILDKIDENSELEYEYQNITNGDKHFNLTFKKKTIITNVFKIQEVTQLKCLSCGHIFPLNYNNYSNIIKLSIDDVSNIILALKQYTTTSFIDDFKCEKCEVTSKIKSRSLLSRIPNILIIQLLRFTNGGIKIDKVINIPLVISLNKFSHNCNNTTLRLVSVSCHVAFSMNTGHYYSIIKKDKWYMVNDNDINELDERIALQHIFQNGYILFYKK